MNIMKLELYWESSEYQSLHETTVTEISHIQDKCEFEIIQTAITLSATESSFHLAVDVARKNILARDNTLNLNR
jgi:hypothetical protein